jgi:hypothetical protein
MKYTVHYKVIRTVTFEGEPLDQKHLHEMALWIAKQDAERPDVELVQVLPEGVPSALGRDNPEPPAPRPLPPPPMPPLGSAGDLMLARAA